MLSHFAYFTVFKWITKGAIQKRREVNVALMLYKLCYIALYIQMYDGWHFVQIRWTTMSSTKGNILSNFKLLSCNKFNTKNNIKVNTVFKFKK